MCFFGSKEEPSETVQNQVVPAPTPAPQAPAASPTANDDKSGESKQSANPGATGYGSLIIPRTAFSPVQRATPQG
jgi:hypothetical protein